MIQIGPMVLTLSIKSKGEDTHFTLREVPEGWPFLKGVEEEVVSSAPKPAVASKPEVLPVDLVAAALREPTLAPIHAEYPARLSAFLARETATTPTTAAVIEAPVAVSASSRPVSPGLSKPIVARSRILRAITCEQVNGVTVVTLLSPDLNEEETVSPVRYELRTLLDDEEIPNRTVIDLGQTKYLSSRAVGVLLAHYQALDREGASMRVCCVSKEIQPVIDQMRLSKLVDIYPTVEEAINDPWE
jgi:anti-anti-sigma factor